MINFLTLIAAAYGTVADIEILLLLIASIGLGFSIYNLRESITDYRVQKSLGRKDYGKNYDPRMVVAINGLRSEIARGLIQAYFITLAIFAMLIPEAPPVHMPLKIVLFGFIFRWGFIMSSILLTLKSYWGYQVRRHVLEHYKPNGEDD